MQENKGGLVEQSTVIEGGRSQKDIKDKRLKVWAYTFCLTLLYVILIFAKNDRVAAYVLPVSSILKLLYMQVGIHINLEQREYYPKTQNLYLMASGFLFNLALWFSNKETLLSLITFQSVLTLICFGNLITAANLKT
jgi:hypothetical protein